MVPKQLERLMYWHTLIRDGQYPSSKTIHNHFKVSTRTAYRDIEILKTVFKAPLAYDPVRRGYHYTQQDWRLFE